MPSPSYAAGNKAGQPSDSDSEYMCTRSKRRRPQSTVSDPASKRRRTRKSNGPQVTQIFSSDGPQVTEIISSDGPQVTESSDDETGDLVNGFIDNSSANPRSTTEIAFIKASQTQSTSKKLAPLRDVDEDSKQCDDSDVPLDARKTSMNDTNTLGLNKDKTIFEDNLHSEKHSTNAGNDGAEFLAVLHLVHQVQALQKNVDDITRRMSSTWLSLQKKQTELEKFRKEKEGVQQQIKELELKAKKIEDLEKAAERDIRQYATENKEGEDHRNKDLEAINKLKEKAAPQVKAFQTTIAILK